jgi:hypothetical protein
MGDDGLARQQDDASMSANFVPKDTIDALVTAALTWGYVRPGEFMFRPLRTRMMRTVTWDDATAVGEMLWRQNWNVTEGWVDPSVDMPEYVFERYAGEPDPVVILKTISYYGYQTGDEPEDYEGSEAAGFLYYLSGVAASKLPGYDDAPFGIYDREAFTR